MIPVGFGDPYKKCVACRAWVDGWVDGPGVGQLVPCGCRDDYFDVCPSWSPVHGCSCPPGSHEMRPPTDGDGKVYGPAPAGGV